MMMVVVMKLLVRHISAASYYFTLCQLWVLGM